MRRHDPVCEFEISSRGLDALNREADRPHTELHRRVIEARHQSRRNDLNDLLARIDATIAAA